MEKQKEIENLAQINSSLQNNIVKASKEKGDLEFELNKKLEEANSNKNKISSDNNKNENNKRVKNIIPLYKIRQKNV